MTKKKSKGAGGKQARSEIIQARLSPKMKFAAELMARKERRTLSSQIEKLIENGIQDFELVIYGSDPKNPGDGIHTKLEFILKQLWSPDEPTRFVRLAYYFPHLLTAEEEARWACICQTPFFWRCYQMILVDKKGNKISSRWNPHHSLDMLVMDHIQHFWDVLTEPDIDRSKLPSIDHAGGFVTVKGEDDKVAAINVRLDIDLSPLTQEEQQQWLNAYIKLANEPNDKNMTDINSATRVMGELVDEIIQGRKDGAKVSETH